MIDMDFETSPGPDEEPNAHWAIHVDDEGLVTLDSLDIGEGLVLGYAYTVRSLCGMLQYALNIHENITKDDEL